MFMTRGSTVGQKSTPGWNQWSGLSRQMGQRPQAPGFGNFQQGQQLPRFNTAFGVGQQGNWNRMGGQSGVQGGSWAGGFQRQTPGVASVAPAQPQFQQPQQQPAAQGQQFQPAQPAQQQAPSPFQAGQPTFQSQIQVGNLYSPQATSQGMANIMALAQQQAASANRYTLPGFARSSPGLQAAANRDASKALMSGIANAQSLGLSDRVANSEQMLAGQRAQFGDVFAQLENALAMQQQQGLWDSGNREMALNAALSQQASDSNWLNMALQGQQQGWNNQLNWLNNLYSMGLNEANLGQQQNNAVLSALLGLI